MSINGNQIAVHCVSGHRLPFMAIKLPLIAILGHSFAIKFHKMGWGRVWWGAVETSWECGGILRGCMVFVGVGILRWFVVSWESQRSNNLICQKCQDSTRIQNYLGIPKIQKIALSKVQIFHTDTKLLWNPEGSKKWSSTHTKIPRGSNIIEKGEYVGKNMFEARFHHRHFVWKRSEKPMVLDPPDIQKN